MKQYPIIHFQFIHLIPFGKFNLETDLTENREVCFTALLKTHAILSEEIYVYSKLTKSFTWFNISF